MTILYNLATRSRPERFKETVENILSLSRHPDFFIWVKVDQDDPTMWPHPITHEKVYYAAGKSTGKVHAINRDMPDKHWDILINVSDDQRFTIVGFDTIIIEHFEFGDNLDQLIHFNDQTPAGPVLPTMSIMGRAYYDRFGYVYAPDYISLFCDEEARDAAQMLGRYKFVEQIIYHHLHPWWVPGLPIDEQLKHTQSFYAQDEKTYNRRKRHGFPLHSVY